MSSRCSLLTERVLRLELRQCFEEVEQLEIRSKVLVVGIRSKKFSFTRQQTSNRDSSSVDVEGSRPKGASMEVCE